jgi:hypothetical protein
MTMDRSAEQQKRPHEIVIARLKNCIRQHEQWVGLNNSRQVDTLEGHLVVKFLFENLEHTDTTGVDMLEAGVGIPKP